MEYSSTMSVAAAPPPRDGQMPDGRKITRNLDGTIIIDGNDGPRIPKEGDFDENLTELFDGNERQKIASQLLEFVKVDETSRRDWVEREQRALEIIGIKDIPAKDRKRPGIHSLVHPVLATSCVQFQSRAIQEFFPPTGPVKGAVIGKKTRERLDQADRIETFMNYYLTDVDRGYFADCDQMLLYLPISGCAFKKCMPDWRSGLPQIRYIKATNFIAPYSGTSLDTMPRYAHRYTMSGQDINRGMAIGLLYDTALQRPADGDARHSRTADTADFREPVLHDDDRLYPVLEYHIEMALDSPELPEDERGIVLPWVILIEESNQEVLFIRRNWREDDAERRKRIWFTKYDFLPGLGFYGFGFTHIIGSLGRAASGAVNALLDSALMSTIPAGFKSKEGRTTGDLVLEPGVFKQVDSSYEDLTKTFYKPDVGKPEPALFQLLDHLVSAAQQFSQTTEVSTGEASNQAPVGTTVALIEESSRVQTAIHKRMHVSAKEEFRMLAEYIHEYMPTVYEYDQSGETRFLLKSDFDGRVDVQPVSDPSIFSSTQRIALAQAVVEAQTSQPDLFSVQKRKAGMRRLLEALRVPDVDEIAPEDDQAPKFLDPVSENQLLAMGEGVRAFPHQDHQAHMAVHKNMGQHLMASGLPPEELDPLLASIGAHIREHLALDYRNQVAQRMGMELPPFDPGGESEELPPDIERGISMLAARDLPPPPPLPGADDAAAEGQEVLDKAAATIRVKDMEAEAQLERDTAAFLAEEQRKQAEFERDQSRIDQETSADLVRKQAQADIDMARSQVEGNLKYAESVRNLQSREAERGIKLRTMKEQAEQKAKAVKKAKPAKKAAGKTAKKAPKKKTSKEK